MSILVINKDDIDNLRLGDDSLVILENHESLSDNSSFRGIPDGSLVNVNDIAPLQVLLNAGSVSIPSSLRVRKTRRLTFGLGFSAHTGEILLAETIWTRPICASREID